MFERLMSGEEVYGFGFGTWLAFLVLILIVAGIIRYFLTQRRAGH